MNLWLRDPVTKKKSVSLTILVTACVLMVVFIVLEAFDALQSSTLLDMYWYTAVSLYFGRRASFLQKKE